MRAWRGVGEENGKLEKKGSKLEQRHFSMSLLSVRGTMKKERRKKKSEEKRRKHFRGTNVIFEFGLSFVNAIFMREN